MHYVIDDSHYLLSFNGLKEDYHKYVNMSDKDFMKLENLIKALHFACAVLYLKEGSPEETVGDKGIIHELVHLLDIPIEPSVNVAEIRSLFKKVLYLGNNPN